MPDEKDVAEKVADSIKSEAEADVVLECRLSPDGKLILRVPKNLDKAAHMHRILGIDIDTKIKSTIYVKEPKVVAPGNKIIIPGKPN